VPSPWIRLRRWSAPAAAAPYADAERSGAPSEALQNQAANRAGYKSRAACSDRRERRKAEALQKEAPREESSGKGASEGHRALVPANRQPRPRDSARELRRPASVRRISSARRVRSQPARDRRSPTRPETLIVGVASVDAIRLLRGGGVQRSADAGATGAPKHRRHKTRWRRNRVAVRLLADRSGRAPYAATEGRPGRRIRSGVGRYPCGDRERSREKAPVTTPDGRRLSPPWGPDLVAHASGLKTLRQDPAAPFKKKTKEPFHDKTRIGIPGGR